MNLAVFAVMDNAATPDHVDGQNFETKEENPASRGGDPPASDASRRLDRTFLQLINAQANLTMACENLRMLLSDPAHTDRQFERGQHRAREAGEKAIFLTTEYLSVLSAYASTRENEPQGE